MIKLTIDVGNTNTLFCFFSFEKVIDFKRIETKKISERNLTNIIDKKKYNFLKEKACIIISSVVPSIDKILKNFLKRKSFNFFFLRDFKIRLKFKTKVQKKKEIGDDRIINMIYAKKKFDKSVIVIDFGTATTLDVLDKYGVYNGGVITPGIDISLENLKKATAKLPLVKFKKTKKVIGNSTVSAIQSGFFWGYVSMIEGLIKKINFENKERYKLVLTGGNANYFNDMFDNIYEIDDLFTSKGLNFLIDEYNK